MENNTRWNSMYDMLNVVIQYKPVITSFWNGKNPDDQLLDFHWDNMQMYTALLQVFLDSTNAFSYVYKPTSPYVLANIIPIAELFKTYRGIDSHENFLPDMEEKFLKYWTDIPLIFVFTMILDPRWKFDGAIEVVKLYHTLMLLPFNQDTNVQHVRLSFFNVYNHYDSRFGVTTRNSTRAGGGGGGSGRISALLGLVNKFRTDTPQTNTTSDMAEYHMYINYDYMISFSDDERDALDLLVWWKEQRRQLPVMSAMARDCLSVQASSVASERAFSASKRVLDEKRTNLRSDTLKMCVCFKDWMDADERRQGMDSSDEENSNDESSTESLGVKDN